MTGKSWNGSDFNIKTVKISSTYSIAWTATLDVNGFDDVASSIATDASGNVIIGGYATRSGGIKDLVCVKYNGSSGTKSWQFVQSSEDPGSDAFVKKLDINNATGNIYLIAGEKGLNAPKQTLVTSLSGSGMKRWQRKIIDSDNDILPSDIVVSNDGIHVVSIADSLSDWYLITKYEDFTTDTSRTYNSSGQPACKKNELIIGFMPSAINRQAIDDAGGTAVREFGKLEDYLTTAAAGQFRSAISTRCQECDIKVMKIYRDLKTTDTVAVSRLGQNVPVPAFWATMLLEFPSLISIQQAQILLKNVPQVVSFSHPNVFIQDLTSPPDDTLYANHQPNLHPISPVDSAHINVEQAWDIVPGGKSFVHGGVFDSGIYWAHEDFGYDGVTAASSKIDGWDFSPNGNGGQPLKQNPKPDTILSHGTPVAGIIGANRNNMKGIAGIAGGDGSTGNPGVQLYSFNIIGSPISTGLAAMFNTSRPGYAEYDFNIDFSNNSWWAYGYNNSELVSLREQVHFAWRQNITFVVARGNFGKNDTIYPATYDSTWVLSVGGTGSNGKYKTIADDEFDWAPSYGSGIDIAAPSVHNIVRSTSSGYGYQTFHGTSAAAPHVSGVVGLLMSYMNDTTGAPNYKNLAPEDCEYIINHSASDVGAPGYDSLTGYGRLNAGRALKMVEKPERVLYHFGTNLSNPHSITKTVYNNMDTVMLMERYKSAFSNTVFNPGKYTVIIFKIDATVTHPGLYPTDSLIAFWPRHSSSYVFNLPDAQKKLNLHERLTVNSCSHNSASLTGYIYQVWDSLGTMSWWPCDTTFLPLFTGISAIGTVMEYSILSKNKAVNLKEEGKEDSFVSVYPNPVMQLQTLQIRSDKANKLTIEVYDIMGRYLKTIYSGYSNIGSTYVAHDASPLPNSMYFYVIRCGDKLISKKFIKE